MKKIKRIINILLGCWILLVSFSHASTLDLTNLSMAKVFFHWWWNNFDWKIFLKDVKTTSEIVSLNGVSKNCTKQLRWYYVNPVRWLRVWPLDEDSLNTLKLIDASYNNLSIAWGLFLCNGSPNAIYWSVMHTWKSNVYYLIAGVTYDFVYNIYIPSFMESMWFLNWLSVGSVFDSYWWIATLQWSWLVLWAVCGNGFVEVWELCDQWLLNGQINHCNLTCNWVVTQSSWWWWGWWWWGWWGITEIPLATWLTIISWIQLNTGEVIEWIIATWSITNSPYNEELTNAYLFAYSIGITTQNSIAKAQLNWYLLRAHAAKMISQFAIRVLEKTPNESSVCKFSDMKDQSLEMQYYAELSCKLGLMWLTSDGFPNTVFNPNATVTRAQFWTMLSRLLYGNKYNKPAVGEDYYTPHLKALQKAGIMKNISMPWNYELRWYVMIMMERIANQDK